MGSKPSKVKRFTPRKTGKAVVPVVSIVPNPPQSSRVPYEIVDEILDHLVLSGDSVQESLRSCSLVSKSWVPSCRRHLFHTITFTSKNVDKWLKTFPAPEKSPAYYVKFLRISFGEHYDAPEEFFKYIPWFANAKTTLTGSLTLPSPGIPLFGRLSHSVTSLAVEAVRIELIRVRDIMMHLPNLNDLTLTGTVVAQSGEALPGSGTVLKGKFGGEFRLRNGYIGEDFVNMLLEAPTGLHFTKLRIDANRACLLQTVRLAEACGKTLVELSYMGPNHGGPEPFERSFDFSNSPNLQKVTFSDTHWNHGPPLHYIPVALSTLKPATSPQLSYICLDFSGPTDTSLSHSFSASVDPEYLRNDLRWITDEFTRIEREYGGAVDLVVSRTGSFVQLDTSNVLRYWDR